MDDRSIAYFSMEIALDEKIPTYSGGLGILAGDMIRAAAEKKLPLLAVTLIHRMGYFHQELNLYGKQIEKPEPWVVEAYLKEEDVYRMHVLESYGYEFIRLHRFNTTTEPVQYINNRIEELINGSMIANSAGHDIDAIIRGQANGLFSGELKECQSCGNVIPISEFKDSTLRSGIGRVCKNCKDKKALLKAPKKDKKPKEFLTGQPCPRCGRKMFLRNGRYGQFYGCSGFPYCKHTQPAVSI